MLKMDKNFLTLRKRSGEIFNFILLLILKVNFTYMKY